MKIYPQNDAGDDLMAMQIRIYIDSQINPNDFQKKLMEHFAEQYQVEFEEIEELEKEAMCNYDLLNICRNHIPYNKKNKLLDIYYKKMKRFSTIYQNIELWEKIPENDKLHIIKEFFITYSPNDIYN